MGLGAAIVHLLDEAKPMMTRCAIVFFVYLGDERVVHADRPREIRARRASCIDKGKGPDRRGRVRVLPQHARASAKGLSRLPARIT